MLETHLQQKCGPRLHWKLLTLNATSNILNSLEDKSKQDMSPLRWGEQLFTGYFARITNIPFWQ